VILTHSHPDHAAGAAAFAALTGAPVLAADPAFRRGGAGLTPGTTITAAGCDIGVVAAPGHTADSVCLHLPADHALLTGDTVLGRGTTVIAADGNLADYLATLDRLRYLTDQAELATLLPGHGPVLDDPAATLDYYIAHRHERLAEVQAALAAGDRTPADIVARIYTGVDKSLWPIAEWSVRAALRYLGDHGTLPPGVMSE
jgi:glyoxylase-like metal-dependent hydrolase (beta-lactamase superfamily II)